MLSVAIVLASLAVSAYVVKVHRKRVEASWKALAAAVPDEPDKALGPAPYREAEEPSSALVPHSRKALDLLPGSRKRMRLQQITALVLPPAVAGLWALFPLTGLGPWSALIGAVWGLGTSVALLRDDRKALGLFGFLLMPLAVSILAMMTSPVSGPMALWAVVGSVATYGAARLVLDQKDAASDEEAYRERMADPRYLVGSSERRAASLAANRGSGGGEEITDASAKSSTTVT